MPMARIICSLSPVACMHRPNSVCRNQSRMNLTTTASTARTATRVHGVMRMFSRWLILSKTTGTPSRRDVAASHDPQVHRVQARHGEDAGEQLGPVVVGVGLARLEQDVQHAGHHAGANAGGHADESRQPRRLAVDDERGGDRRAERQAAVDRQVGEVEHPEGDEDPEHHEGIEQALTERARDHSLHLVKLSLDARSRGRSTPAPRMLPRQGVRVVRRTRCCHRLRLQPESVQYLKLALLTTLAGRVTPMAVAAFWLTASCSFWAYSTGMSLIGVPVRTRAAMRPVW